MNLGQLITYMRRRLDDLAAPYLWSDPELTEYINESEREAAERSRLIYDQDSSVSDVDIRAGEGIYQLHSSVLAVDRVVLASTGKPLKRRTREWLDENQPTWESSQGQPIAFIERENYLILVPKPSEDDSILLALWRLPIEPMAEKEDDPEIHPRYHERMLDWAFHRAYLKRDADTFDQQKSDDYEEKFTESFGIRRDSNVQRKQRLHRVPTVRPQW